MSNDYSLHNKVILITGASKGIGRALSLSCAARQAKVIMAASNVSRLETVFDLAINRDFTEPVILPMDLAGMTKADCDRIAADIMQQYHKLDAVIHCAGILGQRTPLEQQNIHQWEQVMKINVNTPMMLTQSLIPCLEASDNPQIIFTSSSVGKKGRAYWGAYAVSKFATEGMMQVWADELASTSNIRVNCINPGATATDMRAQSYPSENPASIKTPEQAARIYLQLLLDESNKPNGQSIDYS